MEINNMPLIINQGKQDISKDNNKFEIITEKNALVVISEVKLADNVPNTLALSMQILEGPNKNRYVNDKITFDPNSPLSWKYRSVRRAVGVPYQENESTNIDAEAIFLNKALRVDLSVREGKDKLNNPKQYQAINYKPAQITVSTDKAISSAKVLQPTAKPTMPINTKPEPTQDKNAWDDDLPF